MFYLIVIFLSIAATVGANLLLCLPVTPTEAITVIFAVAFGSIAVFLIDALSALIIRRLTPKVLYLPSVKLFSVKKKERNFYRSIKIKRWKFLVPELGGFTSFHKSELKSTGDPEYLERFIVESNYGVVIHLANGLLGFLIALIPFCSSPTVWIPIAAVNLILSLLPVFILRYTLYTLQNLYARSRRAGK